MNNNYILKKTTCMLYVVFKNETYSDKIQYNYAIEYQTYLKSIKFHEPSNDFDILSSMPDILLPVLYTHIQRKNSTTISIIENPADLMENVFGRTFLFIDIALNNIIHIYSLI